MAKTDAAQQRRFELAENDMRPYGERLDGKRTAEELHALVQAGSARDPDPRDMDMQFFLLHLNRIEWQEGATDVDFRAELTRALGAVARAAISNDQQTLEHVRNTHKKYKGVGAATLQLLHLVFGENEAASKEKA